MNPYFPGIAFSSEQGEIRKHADVLVYGHYSFFGLHYLQTAELQAT